MNMRNYCFPVKRIFTWTCRNPSFPDMPLHGDKEALHPLGGWIGCHFPWPMLLSALLEESSASESGKQQGWSSKLLAFL